MFCHNNMFGIGKQQLICYGRRVLCQHCIRHSSKKLYVKPPSGIRNYLVSVYSRYVSWYERHLQKYPKIYEVYKLFKIGLSDFITDTKCYVNVTNELRKKKNFNEFSRKELQTYRQFPSDIKKVVPILVIGALPFGIYLVLPLGLRFPQQLLSHQFWSLEQFRQFNLEYHKQRLNHYPPVLRNIEDNVRKIQDAHLRTTFYKLILDKMSHNLSPTTEEILEVQKAFELKQLALEHLHYRHEVHLSKSLGMPINRQKLLTHGTLIRYIDAATEREGCDKLSQRDIEHMCFVRGLNPLKQDTDKLLTFLRTWTSLSKHTNDRNISMLLHAPILLNYHHASNKKYIVSPWKYDKNKANK